MENNLISRKALIADIHTAEGLGKIIAETIVRFIKKQPTVDAVEVVRCKGCKCFLEYTKEHAQSVEGADGDCYIRVMNSDDKQFCACKYDDFCSYGERKDNENP